MTLVRWSPFRNLVSIQDEMNRMFNSYFGRLPEEEDQGMWYPAVDISESTDEITVKAEVPGMKKEDIKISIQDNILTLKGEKIKENEEKEKNYHRIERNYGVFERSFSLPVSIQMDKVKAKYQDGILMISLPKSEEAKPKEIDVAVN